MPFDYRGGLFSWEQWQRFIDHARSQRGLIEDRIKHLETEIARIGVFYTASQDGAPVDFGPSDPDSYVGKLYKAYQALGGDARYDLQVRSLKDPVYLLPGDETTPPQRMSDGSIMGGPGKAADESASLMMQARMWMDETLRAQKETLERKIRRAVDYVDQLQAEIDYLKRVSGSVEVAGSLSAIEQSIKEMFDNPMIRHLTKGHPDPDGHYSMVDLAGYRTSPDGEAETYQKDPGGVRVPGESGDVGKENL